MTKAELIEKIKDVPDEYTLYVCVSNDSGDVVDTAAIYITINNGTQEILIGN